MMRRKLDFAMIREMDKEGKGIDKVRGSSNPVPVSVPDPDSYLPPCTLCMTLFLNPNPNPNPSALHAMYDLISIFNAPPSRTPTHAQTHKQNKTKQKQQVTFLSCMLQELGLVNEQRDIIPWLKKFDQLDVSGDGKLNVEDCIHALEKGEEERVNHLLELIEAAEEIDRVKDVLGNALNFLHIATHHANEQVTLTLTLILTLNLILALALALAL